MIKLTSHLLAVFFLSCLYSQNAVNVSKEPSWVDAQAYNVNPEVDKNEITQGILTLLADYQVNVFKQQSYFRFVNKVTDNVGIQSGSSINVVYDPLYQKLSFHSIRIVREGKEINKLIPEHFQIIRRELNAESYLYDGSLSALLNLADVRNGDIIDYSYTIKGFNPIENGKFSNSYILNDYVPIGKINVSINTKHKLHYKTFNTNLQPEIKKKKGYTQYSWMVETPDHFAFEDNIPPWKIIMPTVIVGDYNSWGEVVNWAVDIYKVKEPLNKAVKTKIKDIASTQDTKGKKIKAILDFVQNDIRYLGLEYGIGNYKPNPPNKVFEQRFGDCKDKSLLLVHMLKEIDVEAYPMLVNTTLKSTITELLPSPLFFDHCVVKVIDDDKRELYYDPTNFNQGGTYKNTHFPNYKCGLVIKKDNKDFDMIQSSSNNKISIFEKFIIKEVNGGATLNVTASYKDVEADRMRNYFKNSSKSNIVKEYESYYAYYYPKISMVDTPFVQDNLSQNEFVVTESYVIDSIWKPMKLKPNFISIEFVPTSLADILYVSNLENRKNEIHLPYPVSREHKTNIVLPKSWQVEEYNNVISNDIFYYDFNIDYDKDKKEIKLANYLKVQKSFVKPEEFKTYLNDINELNKSFGYTIFIPKNSLGFQDGNLFLTLGKIVFFFFLVVAAMIFIYWIVAKRRKTRV